MNLSAKGIFYWAIAMSLWIYVFYNIGNKHGYESGVASGYLAGMNAKKPRPRVIVITPRCTDIPMLKADSLWRL